MGDSRNSISIQFQICFHVESMESSIDSEYIQYIHSQVISDHRCKKNKILTIGLLVINVKGCGCIQNRILWYSIPLQYQLESKNRTLWNRNQPITT